MGIRGLTTYIRNRSELYLEPFDLHDTYLVVDGYSAACQLYILLSNTNCAFGGDYYKYSQFVKEFFTNLSKCNITPLVILDGGCDEKKLQTSLTRLRDKDVAAKSYTPLSQKNLKLMPLLLSYIFRDVLVEMNIRHVKTLFEADNEIAALAKSLNCPVLSNDSDFFVKGVLYIPFDTLEFRSFRKWKNNVISCKIYKVSNLLNRFLGLDESVLPLLSILIGNDYIEHNTFIYFYQKIKIPKVGRLNFNKQQCLIEGILNWLRNRKLYVAIDLIMSTVPQVHKKRKLIRTIQMIIKEFADTSVNVFYPLGFSKEEIEQINFQNKQNNSNLEMYDDYKKCQEVLENMLEVIAQKQVSDESRIENKFEAFINSLPTWFIEEFYKSHFPSYFIDIMFRNLIIGNAQIEDKSRPSSILISKNILEVICTLLTSGCERRKEYCEIVLGGENNGPPQIRHKLEYVHNIFSFNIPSLDKLKEISVIDRKEIFDITLGVQEHIIEFPINWRLYVITINYWVNHLPDFKSDSHIYVMLFVLLYHIINVKVGYFKSITEFYTKYQTKIKELESGKVTKKNDVYCSTNISITEALTKVTEDDCLLFAPFFITNSEMDYELITNPKKFKRSIIHLFAQFQACWKFTFDLNELLGSIYTNSFVSNMCNGTLLYNLCINFAGRKNIENYINYILQGSPTLLQLFNAILVKAKLMFKLCPCNK